MKTFRSLSYFLSSARVLAFPAASPDYDCSSLSSVDLAQYNTHILNSTYRQAKSVNVSNILNDIPLCEVYGSVDYGTNDSLQFSLWLPDYSNYFHRFMAVGNGGMAGTIDTLNMMTQLNAGLGFAVAGGDAGHRAEENNDGAGEPGVYLPYLHDRDQVEAWIHDAISLFTPAAKAIAEAYYRAPAKHSYYNGCSTGGAQGYALAQYHPELFDGIYAGSPGNWYSHLALSFLWNAQHTNVCWRSTQYYTGLKLTLHIEICYESNPRDPQFHNSGRAFRLRRDRRRSRWCAGESTRLFLRH